MDRKKRNIKIDTIDELKEVVGLFGLSVSISDHPSDSKYKTIGVVSEDGSVVTCMAYDKWEYDEKLQFTLLAENLNDKTILASVVKSIVESLSSKKYMAWKITSRKNIPYGIETVRKDIRVDLPDFSSVEELKIKLAAEGTYFEKHR